MQLSTGTLYGALRRLLEDDWIERFEQKDTSRDKQAYRLKMREVLESQPNLKIKQAEVAELILEDSHEPSAISCQQSAPDGDADEAPRATTHHPSHRRKSAASTISRQMSTARARRSRSSS